MIEQANTHDEFLKQRRGIGSSEIGAILGVNRYMSAVDVWMVKTGRRAEFRGNKYTEAGHRLEPVVADYFHDETGYEIMGDDMATFVHPKFPDIVSASPDRMFHTGTHDGILECKTTQMTIAPDIDELPKSWFCQLQYQMAVVESTGYKIDVGAVAWLERGVDFKFLEFDHDRTFSQSLVENAVAFWESYVATDMPPEPTTGADVELLFPTHRTGAVINTTSPAVVDMWQQLVEVTAGIKELEGERERLIDGFKLLMRDAESIEYMGDALVTWKAPKPSERIDVKRLRAEEPDVWERFKVAKQSSRRFLLKT